MASNTSKGRGRKGSKFWVQTLINLDGGTTLYRAIKDIDNEIGYIKWLSPLKKDNYAELRTQKIQDIKNADLTFWPNNGPWWDGVGIDDKGCVLLVEAKGHVAETKSKCTASSKNSLAKIKESMKITHKILTSFPEYGIMLPHVYDEEVWLNKYYQMGNRLSFLVQLRQQGFDIKLILLNLVNDSTHVSTSLDDWQKHYVEVFQLLLGSNRNPNNTILINFDVG